MSAEIVAVLVVPDEGEPGWCLLWFADGDSDEYWFASDLDPTDDRRLPDGSRYVDRLAMAIVGVNVGSRP